MAAHMLVRNGKIQLVEVYLKDGPARAVVVAANHAQAAWLAKYVETTTGASGIRAAEIGSVHGESMESLCKYAREDGLAMVLFMGASGDRLMFQPFCPEAN